MSIGSGIRLADLIAAICFILALKGLSNPKGARLGNLGGALGMALAVAITFATPSLTRFGLIVGAMAIGVVIGVPAARLVKMTAMPQMVAAFNGVGGGAAALVAIVTFLGRPASSFAVYEVVDANPSARETAQFPTFLGLAPDGNREATETTEAA